jgi:hypothetical protein
LSAQAVHLTVKLTPLKKRIAHSQVQRGVRLKDNRADNNTLSCKSRRLPIRSFLNKNTSSLGRCTPLI